LKRLTAILFLCILLFNLFGYRLVIHYIHDRSTAQLSAKIDNNDYDNATLISIKTPLSLPYYTNSETYERVDGVISIDGEYYNYVKRRVFNDSLELLCLPNTTKDKLAKVEAEYSKSVSNGSEAEKSSKKPTVVKNVVPEFCEHNMLATGIIDIGSAPKDFSAYTFHIPNISLTVSTPPPNVMHVFA
jgi:hypothetical protein